MARVRTLPKAVKECQEKDPGSCITLNALRQWVRQGVVPSTKAGKYFLVDMDKLEEFLSSGGGVYENS